MADYKRLVSYIYNYELGIRRKNVGFSRVESRNGQCKVTIHITASVSSQEPIKAYLFHRDGLKLEGIFLGNMYVKNGTGDFKGETNTLSLMNSGYNLDDISGVILYLSENKFFGSQWDDQEIRIENFYEYDKNKNARKREEHLVKNIVVEPANITDMVMEKELASQVQKSYYKECLKAAEVEEEQGNTSVVKEVVDKVSNGVKEMFYEEYASEQEEAVSQASEEEYTTQEVQSVEEEAAEQGFAYEYEEEQKSEESESASDDSASSEYLSSADIDRQKDGLEDVVLEANSMTNPCCCSENYPECVRNVLKSFPSVKPFPDSNAENWVRIEPKDIGMLPVETWILANNSFLLHGYYNYRHLLFGVLQIGQSTQYVIGVPGLLQSTEQTMAGMFGFHRFLAAQDNNEKQNNFGYWIQQIVL